MEAKKSVPPLKVFVSLVISLNRAQETDVLFDHDGLSSTQWPEFNGYNARQCRDTGRYIPLIDMIPSDLDTIITAGSKAKVQKKNKVRVFTYDLQLYMAAVIVVGHTMNSLTMVF